MARVRILFALAFTLSIMGSATTVVAKGSGAGAHLVGDRWHYRSDHVLRSEPAAARAQATNYYAYLVRKGRRVPPEAEPVAAVDVDHLLPDDEYVRYETAFVIPPVATGLYEVVVCEAPCDHPFGPSGLRVPVRIFEDRFQRRISGRLKEAVASLNAKIRDQTRALDATMATNRIADQVGHEMTLDRIEALEDDVDRRRPAEPSPAWPVVGLLVLAGAAAGSLLGRRAE